MSQLVELRVQCFGVQSFRVWVQRFRGLGPEGGERLNTTRRGAGQPKLDISPGFQRSGVQVFFFCLVCLSLFAVFSMFFCWFCCVLAVLLLILVTPNVY